MTEEHKYVIKEEKDIDFNKMIEKYKEIEYLDEKTPGLSDIEYYKKTLQLCYELIDMLGYFEFFSTTINSFQRIKGIIDELNIIVPEQVDEFIITPEKIKDQFFNLDGKTECEIYANCMYLSNVIAHIMGEYTWLREKLENMGLNSPMSLFFEIKDECIDKLIDAKNIYDDNTLFIEITKDQDKKDVLYIALQNYLEPFSVHLKQEYSSYLINHLNMAGKVGFEYLKNNGEVFLKVPLFPLKLSKKASELIELLYDNRGNINNDSARTIEWYKHMKDKFKSIDEANTTLKAETNKEEVKKGELPLMEKSKGKNNYADANRNFWESVNAQCNNILSPKIMESIITNADGYSYMKIYKKVVPKIHQKINESDEINSDEIDSDDIARKVFIYMKLTGPFSKIANGAMNKAEQEKWIEEAIYNYQRAYEYLELHKEDKAIGIKTMSKALKKYVETEGEVDLLKEKDAKKAKNKPRVEHGKNQFELNEDKEDEEDEIVETVANEESSKMTEENEKEQQDETEQLDISEELSQLVDKMSELKKVKSKNIKDFLKGLLEIMQRVDELEDITNNKLGKDEEDIIIATRELEEAIEAEKKAIENRKAKENRAKEITGRIDKNRDNLGMIEEIKKEADGLFK